MSELSEAIISLAHEIAAKVEQRGYATRHIEIVIPAALSSQRGEVLIPAYHDFMFLVWYVDIEPTEIYVYPVMPYASATESTLKRLWRLFRQYLDRW
jgi:hypothetical protein